MLEESISRGINRAKSTRDKTKPEVVEPPKKSKLLSHLYESWFQITFFLISIFIFIPQIWGLSDTQYSNKANLLGFSAGVAAIACNVPLSADLFLDIASSISAQFTSYRCSMCLALFINGVLIIRNFLLSINHDTLLHAFLGWELYINVYVTICILHQYQPKIWTTKKMIILLVFTLFILIVSELTFNGFLIPHKDITISICIASFYLIFFFLSIQTIKKILFSNINRVSFISLLVHEQMSIIFIIIFIIFSIAYLTIYYISKDNPNQAMYETRQLFLHEGVAVILCLIPGRLLKAKANQMHYDLNMKRSFVKFISHEIRTPMNIIFMGLELVEGQLKEEKLDLRSTSRTVSDLKESCADAMDILNDLLTYEKIDSHNMVLNYSTELSLPFLYEILKPCKIAARAKGIRLQIPAFNAPSMQELQKACINIDKSKMGQVLTNLISNAILFNNSGGMVIVGIELVGDTSVQTKSFLIPKTFRVNRVKPSPSKDPHRKSVRFVVQDSGEGLTSKEIKNMMSDHGQFDLRGHEEDARAGLGLWISKRIVELHGGKLSVRSEGKGKGSTFLVDLPCTIKGKNDFNGALSFIKDLEGVSDSDDDDGEDDNSNKPADPIKGLRGRQLSRLAGMMGNSLKASFRKNLETSFRMKNFSFKYSIKSADNYLNKTSFFDSPVNLIGSRRIQNLEDSVDLVESQGIKVLVVDDSSLNRKIIVKTLVRLNHKCDEADDGQYAVAMVLESMKVGCEMYDVVLMDNFMPTMNGSVAAKKMRTAGYKGIIIGVTGNVLDADMDEYVTFGADAVLSKPMSANTFVTTLQNIQNKRRLNLEVETPKSNRFFF